MINSYLLFDTSIFPERTYIYSRERKNSSKVFLKWYIWSGKVSLKIPSTHYNLLGRRKVVMFQFLMMKYYFVNGSTLDICMYVYAFVHQIQWKFNAFNFNGNLYDFNSKYHLIRFCNNVEVFTLLLLRFYTNVFCFLFNAIGFQR